MKRHAPPAPAASSAASAGVGSADAGAAPGIDFTPVPRHSRRGWHAAAQQRFIAVLAATGSVTIAAAQVGLTREGAYLLRTARGGESFAAAWDAAVVQGLGALKAIAFDRAIHGEPVPIFYQGEQIGERRQHSNSLLMRLITHYDGRQRATAATLQPSSDAVAARLRSKARAIRDMDAADFARNQQWLDYGRLNRLEARLALALQLRRWIAEGGLETIMAHIEFIERDVASNPLMTPALHDQIARHGAIDRSWAQSLAPLERLLAAEGVEAAAAAGLLGPKPVA